MSSKPVVESFKRLVALMTESTKAGVLQSDDNHFESLEAHVASFSATFNTYAVSLKMQQNSIVPAVKLPDEVLQEIFHLALVHLSADGTPNDHTVYYAALYRLIRVCRRWATVLKTTPELWQFISSQTTPELQKIALQSSVPLPLHVEYNYQKLSGPLQSASFPVVMSGTVDRWKDGTFNMDNETLLRMAPILRSPASKIERVSLVLKNATGAEKPKRLDLFNGQAPHLKHIYIVGLSLRWTSPVLHGLTALTLANIRDGAPSVDDVLEILRHTPELEYLFIDRVSLANHNRTELPPKVQLPRLRLLFATNLPPLVTVILIGTLHSLPSCRSFNADFDCGQVGLAFENILGHLVPDLRRLIEMSNPTQSPSHDISIGLERDAVDFTAGEGGLFTFAVEHCPIIPSVVQWFSTVVQGCGKTLAAEVCFYEDALTEAQDETLLRVGDFDVVSIQLINTRGVQTVLQYLGRRIVGNGVPMWPFPNVNSISLIRSDDADEPGGWTVSQRILNEVAKMVEQRTNIASDPALSPANSKALKLAIEGFAVGDTVRSRLIKALGRDQLLIRRDPDDMADSGEEDSEDEWVDEEEED